MKEIIFLLIMIHHNSFQNQIKRGDFMNNTRKFLQIITAAFLVCVFAGCSGINDNKTAGNSKQILLTGTIATAGARSATASFELPQGANFRMEAVQGDTQTDITINDNLTFKAVLPCAGNWTICLYIVGGGNLNYYITSREIKVLEGSYYYPMGDFEINPSYDGYGDIDLKLICESPNVKYLLYSAKLCTDTGYENSLAETQPIEFSNDVAALKLDRVHANPYEVIFYFCDSTMNVLYSCKEVITVLAGFETNTWVGKGAQVTESKKGENESEFLVTISMINNYKTDNVPDSKVLLYNKFSGDSGEGYKFYETDLANPVIQDSAPSTFKYSGYNDYISTCFDADGYYYVITDEDGSSTTITSNNPDFGNATANGVYEYMTAYEIGKYFSIDRKTGIYYSSYPSYSQITQLTDARGNWLSGTDAINYTIVDGQSRVEFDGLFAIYDGVAYLPLKNDSCRNLYVADLSTAYEDDNGDLVVQMKLYTFPRLPNEYKNYTIKDILYQDEFVYLLLNANDINPSGNLDFYSTGAILRFSLFRQNFEYTPYCFANAIKHDDETYVEVKGDGGQKFYNNSDPIDPNTQELVLKAKDIQKYDSQQGLNIQLFNLYSPKTTISGEGLQLSNTALYGPQKFIAIKPKKLVIADDGIAFYVDTDGLYKYKNVNRIVIVDLEKFSYEETAFESIDTNMEFEFKETSGSGYIQSTQTSGSYWAELPQSIPLYTKDTKELYQNCVYCGGIGYMQNEDFKFFVNTSNDGLGARPYITRKE